MLYVVNTYLKHYTKVAQNYYVVQTYYVVQNYYASASKEQNKAASI